MSSDTFLTPEELNRLTGFKRYTCQVRKLREYGLRYFVAADGRPVVYRGEIETRTPRRGPRPNFEFLED